MGKYCWAMNLIVGCLSVLRFSKRMQSMKLLEERRSFVLYWIMKIRFITLEFEGAFFKK